MSDRQKKLQFIYQKKFVLVEGVPVPRKRKVVLPF